jgi:hypothetical protein
MIAVALAVIAGVVAVTCGVVADSNHADTLSFLGLMVKTTAAQIFLAGAICTWALFAAVWLLSVGVRRSRQRGLELRALRALRADLRLGVYDGDEAVGAAADMTAPSSVRTRATHYGNEPTLTEGLFPGEVAPLEPPEADWNRRR